MPPEEGISSTPDCWTRRIRYSLPGVASLMRCRPRTPRRRDPTPIARARQMLTLLANSVENFLLRAAAIADAEGAMEHGLSQVRSPEVAAKLAPMEIRFDGRESPYEQSWNMPRL